MSPLANRTTRIQSIYNQFSGCNVKRWKWLPFASGRRGCVDDVIVGMIETSQRDGIDPGGRPSRDAASGSVRTAIQLRHELDTVENLTFRGRVVVVEVANGNKKCLRERDASRTVSCSRRPCLTIRRVSRFPAKIMRGAVPWRDTDSFDRFAMGFASAFAIP